MAKDDEILSGQVYEPAEDSYLLATTVCEVIRADATVLDIGTGSGYVGIRIAEKTGADVLGVDINPHACREAAQRGLPVVQGNLTAPFRRNRFDVVVCNPPYLPTSPEEQRSDWLAVAVDGGPDGRSVVNSLLIDLPRVLKPDGSAYLLVSSLQNAEKLNSRIREVGFESEEVARDDSFPFEVLSIRRLNRAR